MGRSGGLESVVGRRAPAQNFIVDGPSETIQNPTQQLVTHGGCPAASLRHDARAMCDPGRVVERHQEGVLVSKPNHLQSQPPSTSTNAPRGMGGNSASSTTDCTNDTPRHMLKWGALKGLLERTTQDASRRTPR